MQISGGTPQEKALNFVQQNKALFAIQTGKDDYLVKKSKEDNFGLEHVVLQQYVMGVPVFDGVLKFHLTKQMPSPQ